jgi:hypothetical protein
VNKRQDFTVRFAENGIIVQTYHHPGDYSRNTLVQGEFEELVFNKLIDFERWFERHSDMNDDGSDLTEMTMGDLAQLDDDEAFIKPEWIRRAVMKGSLVMGVDPAAPGEDKTFVIYDDAEVFAAMPGESIKPFEPKPVDENVVDALREAENVVKRFTGVKP